MVNLIDDIFVKYVSRFRSVKLLLTTLLFFIGFWYQADAQAIDNVVTYKSIPSDSYFRLNYENDFFSAIDEYYTQGVTMEVVSPSFRKFPLEKLLVHPGYSSVKYGIGIEHNGYTPSSISSDDILYADRPFAGCLFLKTFLIATDPERKQRFSSALSTGIIGPGAGAKEVQVNIHRWLNNITPHGWQYQVNNDVILNYEVEYSRQVFTLGKFFMVDADVAGRVGTISDKATTGLTIMAGLFDSPYGNTTHGKDGLHIYVYEHPEAAVVAYDATMQGGMFNRTSPYIITDKDINRATWQNRAGFVISYRGIYLEYFKTFLTREFQTGKPHSWGGVQLAFRM